MGPHDLWAVSHCLDNVPLGIYRKGISAPSLLRERPSLQKGSKNCSRIISSGKFVSSIQVRCPYFLRQIFCPSHHLIHRQLHPPCPRQRSIVPPDILMVQSLRRSASRKGHRPECSGLLSCTTRRCPLQTAPLSTALDGLRAWQETEANGEPNVRNGP